MPQPWLENVHRRTLKDVDPIVYRHIERRIYNLIHGDPWPYKVRIPFYVSRDRAMMALLFMTMGRIHEVLKLTTEQFDMSSEPDFIVIRDFNIGKRKEKTVRRYGKTYVDIPISKDSIFLPLITTHLNQAKKRLFKFGRNRAYKIVRHVTGLWCHWFRAQSQSFYVNKLGNPMVVAKMFKVDIKTIQEYYRGTWRDHTEKLK